MYGSQCPQAVNLGHEWRLRSPKPHVTSSLLRNSRSFCSTSSSSLSTLYCSASRRCFSTRACSFALPSNWLLLVLLDLVFALARETVERVVLSRRPCWSSARARRDSIRRSTRSMCASARSRSVVMAGESSERSEASAVWSVVCGISS